MDLITMKAMKGIQDEMSKLSLAVLEVSASDFAQYQKTVGKYQGLKLALEVIKRAEQEDLDDGNGTTTE